MIYQNTLAVLRHLLLLTQQSKIRWSEASDGWFTSKVAGSAINFRFLYFEAANQVGADPHTIELMMPGLNEKLSCGTEGFSIMLELLGAAFPHWRMPCDQGAIAFLLQAFPDIGFNGGQIKGGRDSLIVPMTAEDRAATE